MTKKKVYIAGSTGMVGRNITENLDKSKYEIFTTKRADLDLLDYEKTKKYINDIKPDYIINAAGKVGGISANNENPYGFFTENILIGINLVKSAYETGVQNFLNLSSSCSYPCNAPIPLKEEYLLSGKLEKTNEGYAIAKSAIAKMCEFITTQNKNLNYKTIILCNLYGKYDKYDENNSHLIPAIIKKVHYAKENNLPHIEIWGDGTPKREIMFATDLGIMMNDILRDFDKIPTIMNIGTGTEYSVNEYYEIIAKIIGYQGKFTHDLNKLQGVNRKLLELSLQNNFGYKPAHTLEEGITETYNNYLEYEQSR